MARTLVTVLACMLMCVSVHASEDGMVFSTALTSVSDKRKTSFGTLDVAEIGTLWNARTTMRSRAAAPSTTFVITSDHSNTTYETHAAGDTIVDGYGIVVGTSVGNVAGDIAVIVADYESDIVYVSSRSGGFVQSGFFPASMLQARAAPPYALSTFPSEAMPLNSTDHDGSLMRRRSCPPQRTEEGRIVLRVGVLHTPQAASLPAYATTGGSTAIQMEVAAAVAEANTIAFRLSGVAVEIQLCVNGPLSPNVAIEKTSSSSTLGAFASSPSVSAIRDAGACDVMVLFSSLAGLGNSACGIGYMFPGAHAVVAAPCFKDNYSFIHELLHTFGSCHGEPAMTCGAGANGFGDATHGFRTIEAYSSACGRSAVSCTRIPRVSNSLSEFTWNGWPIGNQRHSNAWIVNANAQAASTRRC